MCVKVNKLIKNPSFGPGRKPPWSQQRAIPVKEEPLPPYLKHLFSPMNLNSCQPGAQPFVWVKIAVDAEIKLLSQKLQF